MQFKFFSKNGQILPIEQATISLENIAYSYGFGVYETLKVRKHILYFVQQHVERLCKSAEIITLSHLFSKSQIIEYITVLVEKNNVSSCNIKMLLVGGSKKEDALLFILPLAPLFPDRKLYSQGAKTITVRYERLYPNAKTLNMLGSYVAYKKAQEQDCFDALLLDAKNNVLEGTRTNFFVIHKKTLVTPPTDKVLEGVTRDTVFYVAKKNGYTVQERDIALEEMQHYSGSFLTSTSTKIMPVKQINDMMLEIPEELRQLMKLYDEFLDASKGIFQ